MSQPEALHDIKISVWRHHDDFTQASAIYISIIALLKTGANGQNRCRWALHTWMDYQQRMQEKSDRFGGADGPGGLQWMPTKGLAPLAGGMMP